MTENLAPLVAGVYYKTAVSLSRALYNAPLKSKMGAVVLGRGSIHKSLPADFALQARIALTWIYPGGGGSAINHLVLDAALRDGLEVVYPGANDQFMREKVG